MATTKISQLNPLLSGSTCADAVLPVVNDGVTDKISIDNLRGTLRGASNQGGSCAALVGGINNNAAGGCSAVVTGFRNTATNGGEFVGGGQDNIVEDNIIARSLGINNYNVPELNGAIGSYSAIMGGARNNIYQLTASVYNNDYSISPSVILSGVDNKINLNETPNNAYYPYVGQNMILGGVSNEITSSASGNYPMGSNTIINGSLNQIKRTVSASSNSYMYHNLIGAGMRHQMLGAVNQSSILSGWGNKMISNTVQSSSNSYDAIWNSTIVGGSDNLMVNSIQNSFIAGGQDTQMYSSPGCNRMFFGFNGSARTRTYNGNNTFWSFAGGGRGNRITSSSFTTVVGGLFNSIGHCKFNTFEGGCSHGSTVIGGAGNQIYKSLDSAIIGGNFNCISSSVDSAVILGGECILATVDNAAHVAQLVFKTGTGGIPTSNPNVLGQVWSDAGALKISFG